MVFLSQSQNSVYIQKKKEKNKKVMVRLKYTKFFNPFSKYYSFQDLIGIPNFLWLDSGFSNKKSGFQLKIQDTDKIFIFL